MQQKKAVATWWSYLMRYDIFSNMAMKYFFFSIILLSVLTGNARSADELQSSANSQIMLFPDDLRSVVISDCDINTKSGLVRYQISSDKNILKAQLLVNMITHGEMDGSVFLGRHPLSGERFYSIAEGVTPGGAGFCRDDNNPACIMPLNQEWMPVRCLWLKRSELYPSRS
jgi:hypothetical protein